MTQPSRENVKRIEVSEKEIREAQELLNDPDSGVTSHKRPSIVGMFSLNSPALSRDAKSIARGLHCPTCDSPQPSWHPAAGDGGEITKLCPDLYHNQFPTEGLISKEDFPK